MLTQKKRGFSFTWEGSKILAWFSTDNDKLVECSLIDATTTKLVAKGVAALDPLDTFSIITGEKEAFKIAVGRLLSGVRKEVLDAFMHDQNLLNDFEFALNRRMSRHLRRETRREKKIKDKSK